mgnify:CR=1 FL=1
MEQYTALVAKINNLIKDARHRYTMSKVQFSLSDRVELLENLLSFLDTLEVKEVDSNDAIIEKACEYIDGLIELLNDRGHQLKKERIIDGLKQAMRDE